MAIKIEENEKKALKLEQRTSQLPTNKGHGSLTSVPLLHPGKDKQIIYLFT